MDNQETQNQYTFTPYVGSKYESGINKEKEKVLIIGPRHYCDAINDSRNLIPSLIKAIKDDTIQINNWQNITLTKDEEIIEKSKFVALKIGCLRESSKSCLKDSYSSKDFVCPVLKDQECPLKENCPQTKEGNPCPEWCDGNRQLRCETLIAIYDYLNSNAQKGVVYQILSAEHGHSYFSSITQYLKKRFKIDDSPWEKVVFMNLLQHYAPYRGILENDLYNYTQDNDVIFTINTIKKHKPTYIIATMKYVANELLGTKFERKSEAAAESQKWFKDNYGIENENGFILLKVKGKNAKVLLSNLNSESVFNSFLRFYKELNKPSLSILVCTFLFYGLKFFQENYKEYNIKESELRNILLDHIVIKKEDYKKNGTNNNDIDKLIKLLGRNKAFNELANRLEGGKLKEEKKNKEKNSKEARRTLCRNIDNYGNQTSEMAIKLTNIFSQILSDIPDSSSNKG